MQGSYDSYASAAERQSSFATQASSRVDSFHDAGSRIGSFVSASGHSFPERFNSATSGGRADPTDTVIAIPQQEQPAQLQALNVDTGSLSSVPPSQQQGWR